MIKKIFDLYKKYKEIVNYLIAGFLTTVVALASFFIFKNVFHIHYIVSNVISWIIAVLFAYIINRRFVFESNSTGKSKLKEFINFIKYRLLSLLIETLCLYLLVDIIHVGEDISKIIVQIIVIILNYVFSKFLTFVDKGKKETDVAKNK